MEVLEFEGKNLEELKENSIKELDLKKEDVIITTEEIKGSLLKKTSYKIKVYTLKNIQEYIKLYLTDITKLMGVNVTFESKIRDNQIYIKMYSDKNSILIGKEGKTLSSLTTLVKQMLSNQYKGNTKLASIGVFISTLCSVVSIPLVAEFFARFTGI